MKGVLPLLLLLGLGGCASSTTNARVAEADPWAGFNNGYVKEPEKPAEAPAPPRPKAPAPAATAAPKQVSAPAAPSAPKQISAPAAGPDPAAEPSGASQAADLLENARPTRAPVASTAEPAPTKPAKKYKHPASKGARGKARRHPKPGS